MHLRIDLNVLHTRHLALSRKLMSNNLVLKILVRGAKIFNLFAENFGPGPKFSIDNPEKNGPPPKILVRGGRIRFNFLCCVTATNKQSGIIEIEVVGHKLQQCKG